MEEILASIRRIIADDPAKTPRHESAGSQALRSEKAKTNDGLYRDRAPLSARREDPPRPLPSRGDGAQAFPPPFSQARAGENRGGSQPPANPASFLSGANAPAQPAILSARSEQPSAAPAKHLSPQEEIDAMLAELNSRTRAAAREPEEPAADILELTEEVTAQEAPADVVFPDVQTLDDTHAADETRPSAALLDTQEDQGEELRDDENAVPNDVQSQSYAAERETEYVRDPSQESFGGEIDEGLVSSATTAAVDSAFNALAQTVLVQNARTLEDLVREMLRPMLKTWLDDNLPGLVERLVRAEIERVSRGRA
jgi:cell pole-organizing protein PopZ